MSAAEGLKGQRLTPVYSINCKGRLARLTHMTYYSGGMLSGAVVQRQGMLRDWNEIEADSPMARIARRVC